MKTKLIAFACALVIASVTTASAQSNILGGEHLRHGIKPEQPLRLTTHELERDLCGWALRN
jgi:hypothetical protein